MNACIPTYPNIGKLLFSFSRKEHAEALSALAQACVWVRWSEEPITRKDGRAAKFSHGYGWAVAHMLSANSQNGSRKRADTEAAAIF